MSNKFTEGEDFKNQDYTASPLEKGEYENCSFTACNFSNSDLAHVVFVECEFIDCDLSTANVNDTAFREVRFKNCKLLGLHFENCNDFLFALNCNNCQLNLSSFYKKSLKGAQFIDCSLHEADLTEADFSKAVLKACDLRGAIFDHTNLTATDLRSSTNYSIDPENNSIKKAKFSMPDAMGLLSKYDIHIE